MTDSPQPDGTHNPGPAYTPGAAPIPPPQPAEPVNYAPPGYTPDYGQGHQYAPPYGYPPAYAPPPPPPRKSNAPLIAVVIAVALLLCGGAATAGILVVHRIEDKAHEVAAPLTHPTVPDLPGGGLPTDLPTDLPTEGGKQIQVSYEVTGDGPAEIIYLSKLGASPTRADDVKLPWRFSAAMQTPTLISIIAMRTDAGTGTITCRALVDGKEVKKVTSGDNGFATAACTYFALD